MTTNIEELEALHTKCENISSTFQDLPERDIRKTYFEIISGQIAVCLTNMRVNIRFSEVNKEEFSALFNGDAQQMDNYAFQLIQNMAEAIMDAALFQSELVFRYYYSKITGETPGKEKGIQKIIATLYDDVQNNWNKEECKQIVLLWTLRNTIHTGGIYFVKPDGFSLEYKNRQYKFEYGKAPEFLKDGYSLTMVSDLLSSIETLFNTDKIKDLGSFDHPNYAALGY